MKILRVIILFATLALVACLQSCAPYNTNAVSAHAGASYTVGTGRTAMAMAPTMGRYEGEAAKSKAFFGR